MGGLGENIGAARDSDGGSATARGGDRWADAREQGTRQAAGGDVRSCYWETDVTHDLRGLWWLRVNQVGGREES